jgi:hypothetical protein
MSTLVPTRGKSWGSSVHSQRLQPQHNRNSPAQVPFAKIVPCSHATARAASASTAPGKHARMHGHTHAHVRQRRSVMIDAVCAALTMRVRARMPGGTAATRVSQQQQHERQQT